LSGDAAPRIIVAMIGPRTQTSGRRGFALLIVIGALALMALLATGFAAASRTETRIAHNRVESARARAVAEAGVAEAIAGLLEANPATQWHADGTVRTVNFGGAAIRITVQDEGGKLDLNWAPPEQLSRLVSLLGLAHDAPGVVGAIMDRRRAVPRPENWLAAGMAAGQALLPRRNASAFRSVDELRQVAAIDRDAFERLRPYVTVYSQTSGVNLDTAPRPVLLAASGAAADVVDAFLASRGSAGATQPQLAGGDQAGGGLRAATITAEGVSPGGARFVRVAVVAFTGDPSHPFHYLEWREDLTADP
jgi:general secretion pathway protein K